MQELGVKPSESTQALHESIRAGHCDSAGLGPNPMYAGDMGELPLHRPPALVDYLERLQSTFAGIVARLRQEIPSTDTGETR